jgi:hypothetical protein
MGWTEAEIRATILAYFQLMAAQEAGGSPVKVAIYRQLSAQFPNRSPKAFERKFQNISAILYELRLPFCDGLKPSANYQRLLRLLVLDHLDRTPIPPVEPHEILISRLKTIYSRGSIKVNGKGPGRFGLSLEDALGVPPNSSPGADFMGIELKTKSGSSLQTMFSRVPSRYVGSAGRDHFFEDHCYRDKSRNRRALYTSFSSTADSFGFKLVPSPQVVSVKRNRKTVMEYDCELLEEALLSKHTQSAYIALDTFRKGDQEWWKIEKAVYCKWPSILRFLKLIEDGSVHLDLTFSDSSGRVRDHGFLWRIKPDSVPDLYLRSESIGLAGPDSLS